MKKVLWLSRHDMTSEQLAALGDVEVTKFNVGNLPNVHVPFSGYVDNSEELTELPPFKVLLQDFDVLAVVLPINLEAQVLGVAGDRPMIKAINNRSVVKATDGGEDRVVFTFDSWKRVKSIEVVMVDYPG